MMAELTSLSRTLGIRDQTIFHDFADRSELSQIYNAADIGVWPGDPSITVLEALATGLACLLPVGEEATI